MVLRRIPVVRGLLGLRDLPHMVHKTHEREADLSHQVAALQQQVADLQDQMRIAQPRSTTYVGDHTVLTNTVWNTRMYVDSRDIGFTPHIIADGVWEGHVTQAFLRQLRPGMTVVEVGANFGYFTLIGARTVGSTGTYYAFEPNENTFRHLERSIVINGLSGIAHVYNKAVSDTDGTITLQRSDVYTTNSNIVWGDSDIPPALAGYFSHVEVEVVSLDTMLGKTAHVDFVKIDAEGSEAPILRGMEGILTANPHIRVMLEYAPYWGNIRATSADLLDYARRLGFRFWVIGGDGGLVPTTIPDLLKEAFTEVLIAREL